MTPLEQVRAKVIEAVPEAAFCRQKECKAMPCQKHAHHVITLADVLRAIQETKSSELIAVLEDGEFWNVSHGKAYGIGVDWNLSLPFDEQEPEVIEFLHKILCT